MATQQSELVRLQQYAQALNPQVQVAYGSNFWLLFNAVAMSATDKLVKIATAAQQYLLSSASADGLTALCAQFGVIRNPAVAGTAPYVFAVPQANPNQAITLPANTIVQTQSQPGQTPAQYQTLQSATIPAGQTLSNTVTVQALVGGVASNVGSGTITVVATAPSGVSGSNSAAVGGGGYLLGADAESDAALRARTLNAIAPANSIATLKAAALSVSGVFAATVVDAQDEHGNYTVYACQADGTLPSGLQSSVLTAVRAAQSVGVTPTVIDFTAVTQAVAATITVAPTATYATVAAAVAATITSWVGALQPGQALLNTDLTRACFGAQNGYLAVAGLTDMTVTTPTAPGLAATSTQVIRLSGTPTITLGSL